MDLHWANNIVFEFVKNYFVAFVTRFEYGKDALLITINIGHIVPATMKVVANKTSEHLSMSFFYELKKLGFFPKACSLYQNMACFYRRVAFVFWGKPYNFDR